ncbi:MAG: DMT family transporter [Reyranellaceae bacterium]
MTKALPTALRGMLWMAASGALFAALNTIMKWLAHDLDPWVVGFLRYLFGFLVLLPVAMRLGWRGMRSGAPGLQVLRGAFHVGGLLLWFMALPMVSMAEMTALGFTGPIFMCLGAVVVLGEKMSAVRWAAVLVGFLGTLIVVHPWTAPGFGVGWGSVLLLLASPTFAASFITAKVLTRHDSPEAIVIWQHGLVALFALPFALTAWTMPSAWQWGWFVLCGLLGAAGHYCVTQALRIADVSATQPVRFLDLLWASLGGFIAFSSVPEGWTIAGGVVIFSATLWLARHEARIARAARARAGAAPQPAPAA